MNGSTRRPVWIGTELLRSHLCRECGHHFASAQRVLTSADAEELATRLTSLKAGSSGMHTSTGTYAMPARVSLRTTVNTGS